MTTALRFWLIILVAFLVGCSTDNRYTTTRPTATPLSDVISAQATQIYSGAASQVAIAQATYVAEQSAIRATAEWQATDVAVNATISAHDIGYLPTRAAIQATIDAARAGEAQARRDAALLNVALAVTQQADTVKLASLDIVSKTAMVTAQAQFAQATATAVAKQLANSQTVSDADTLTNIVFAALVKIGGAVIVFIAVLTGIRKWQQKDSIQQPHPDGPAFEIQHSLLKAPEAFVIWNPYEERAKLSLPAPRQTQDVPLDAAPVYQGEQLRGFVESESARELSEAELMRRRVLNFLRLVIEYYADDPDNVVVPHWETLKPLAEARGGDISGGSNEWVAITDSLAGAGCIDKRPGKKTLLIGQYMTFPQLYAAIGQKRIPLPVVVRQKAEKQPGNSTVQYGSNSRKQSKTVVEPSNSAIINSIPGVTR